MKPQEPPLFKSIVDTPAFDDPLTNNPRVNQQKILSGAVKERLLGKIITGNPESLESGSGIATQSDPAITNGTSRTFVATLTDNFGRVLFAVPDVTFYISTGTVTISAANQYPNATHNMTNVPIAIWNDWGATDNVNIVNKASLYNNSGSTINVIHVIRWRIITNPVGGKKTGNA